MRGLKTDQTAVFHLFVDRDVSRQTDLDPRHRTVEVSRGEALTKQFYPLPGSRLQTNLASGRHKVL